MRRAWFIFMYACAALWMAIPAFADLSLHFDFNNDGVYDTAWELDPPPPGGSTMNATLWLDGYDTSPWAAEPLFGVVVYFKINPALMQVNSITINDTSQGGPFDPGFSGVTDEGGGVYLLEANNFSCFTIIDKVKMATFELECIGAGTSNIILETSLPDVGIVPGGTGCIDPHWVYAIGATAVIDQNECETDAECWNGSWCDGVETCSGGLCVPGSPPCADDGNDCTDICIEGSPPAESNPGTCNVCNATGIADPCCSDAICSSEPVCTIAINNYYVDGTGGSNANDGLTPATAWKTITYALSQVTGTPNNQAIINVASGTYDTIMGGGDAETFPLEMENYVSLKGAGYKTTIIDAGQTAGVIRCFIVSDVSIEGFTLRNGWAVRGGAIFMYHSSAIALTGCRITDNTAFGTDGGGIFARGTSPAITNCVISNNSAVEYGGGIACYEQSDAVITNCTIVNNEALDVIEEGGGGGACNNESSPVVMNSILWNNQPNEILLVDPLSSITISYSNVAGGYPGIGNINADPGFLTPDDFYLTFGSPCIDAGNSSGAPLADIDGTARFNDLTTPDTGAGPITYYDIGAYEFDGDSDKDGVPDDGDQSGGAGDNPCTTGVTTNCDDNCLTVPNGPDLGTCSAGTLGSICLSNGDCGPDGVCSLAQEDADQDGVGNVCDNCVNAPNGPLRGTCGRLVNEFSNLEVATSRTCVADTDCVPGQFCILDQADANDNGAGNACECLADANHDCKVNTTDLGILKIEIFRTDCNINPCQSDADGNGKVNTTDMLIMKVEFFRTNCQPCSAP